MKSKLKMAAAGAALALAAAILVAPTAMAHGWGIGGDRGADLADALGITLEELQDAQDKAMDAHLDRMLESGRVDAEQVDLMRARRALDRSIDRDALMAEALGISPEALDSAREEGTTMDLLESQELDMSDYQERYQAAYQAAVDQAVADGVITQEQADALSEHGGKFGMHGGCMGRSGMKGFHGTQRMRGFHGFDRGRPGGEQTHGWSPRAPRSQTVWGSSDI